MPGPPKTTTPEVRRQKLAAYSRQSRAESVRIRSAIDRWKEIKTAYTLETDADVADLLIQVFNIEERKQKKLCNVQPDEKDQSNILEQSGFSSQSWPLGVSIRKDVFMRNVGTQSKTQNCLLRDNGNQTILNSEHISAVCGVYRDSLKEIGQIKREKEETNGEDEGEKKTREDVDMGADDEEKENKVINNRRWMCLKAALGCFTDTDLANMLIDWFVESHPVMKMTGETVSKQQMQAAEALLRRPSHTIEPYLLTMRVTKEQDLAIKTLCTLKGWNYKPSDVPNLTYKLKEYDDAQWFKPSTKQTKPTKPPKPKPVPEPIKQTPVQPSVAEPQPTDIKSTSKRKSTLPVKKPSQKKPKLPEEASQPHPVLLTRTPTFMIPGPQPNLPMFLMQGQTTALAQAFEPPRGYQKTVITANNPGQPCGGPTVMAVPTQSQQTLVTPAGNANKSIQDTIRPLFGLFHNSLTPVSLQTSSHLLPPASNQPIQQPSGPVLLFIRNSESVQQSGQTLASEEIKARLHKRLSKSALSKKQSEPPNTNEGDPLCAARDRYSSDVQDQSATELESQVRVKSPSSPVPEYSPPPVEVLTIKQEPEDC